MKNTKCLIALFLVFCILPMSAFAKSMEFTITSDTAYISDNSISPITLDAAPVISNDRTLVPIRVIAENFGAEVFWDETEKTVRIVKSDLDMLFKIDDNTSYINGEAILLDTAPLIINSRTMLPLRFISENLNMNVEYVSSTQQVYITDEKPAMKVNGKNVYLDDFKFFMISDVDEYNNIAELLKSVYTFSSLAEYSTTLTPEEIENRKMYVRELLENYNQYTTILAAPVARFYESYIMAEDYVNDLFYNMKAEISDSEIQSVYNDDYLCAKHILVSDKALADSIIKKIKKGEDFDDLMNEYSEDPGLVSYPNGYVFTSGDMVPEFENAVISLEIGQISGVVESTYGYHIIKREELPELNDSVKEEITASMPTRFIEFVMSSVPVETYMTQEEIIEAVK